MSVAALVAEILIVGIQATIWIGLLVLSFIDYETISWSYLSRWQTLIATLYLATSYYLGIIVDRLSDSTLGKFDKSLRQKHFKNKDYASAAEARLTVMVENENVSRFLDYVRSRMRIARSTCFNTVFITISVIIFTVSTQNAQIKSSIVIIIITGLSICAITIFVWRRITMTYYKRLTQAYEIVKAKKA